MIKTLIADDEQHAIDRLKDLLSDYEQFQIVAIARDGSEALEKTVSLNPEVAFLDINMPGVSVFKTISSLNDPPLIIFQTAHSKYATNAFDINALDYLLKPISRERFQQAVLKILDKMSQGSQKSATSESPEKDQIEKISVKTEGVIKVIPVDDIQKICFEEGLSFLYTREGRFLSDHSLNYFEQKLESAGFFRSSRAALINLNFITTISKGFKGGFFIELKDGSKAELSRRKAQVLKKLLDF
ncbi:LytTR family DNA-binding domain-containing protein [bacterium]|nr:LytTR family DNA-binding domain-containing protein [bacterium]